jgi:hypothetical protein
MTANPDVQYRRKTKSALVHLRTLPDVEPATSTGRVAWIWPEIEAALATGKKLREVFDAARADGLDIPYPQFRVYVSRLRNRRLKHVLNSEPQPRTAVNPPATPTAEPPYQAIRSVTFASSGRKNKRPDSTTIPSQFKSS